ncbi:hypothetical protein [Thalassolituus oleivorans]|uniref:hypothetical protein n=1 Tax=Thalassolituus oleivorans TaxID=187493 RepID=UPI0023F42A0C|nr:hypothetical protein [Thalassolituus oleivorans]
MRSISQLAVIFLSLLIISQSYAYTWTQSTRWREDARTTSGERKLYQETLFPLLGYDERPHQQLRNMFPAAIVGDGNNKETSDNLWDSLMVSEYVVGNAATGVRAKDLSPRVTLMLISLTIWENHYDC